MLSTVPKSRFAIFSLLAGRGELYAITHRELPLLLSVDGDSNLTARVIGGLLPIRPCHGQSVRLGIHSKDAGVFTLLDAGLLRCARVPQDVIDLYCCAQLRSAPVIS
jgi:hypothetical protein